MRRSPALPSVHARQSKTSRIRARLQGSQRTACRTVPAAKPNGAGPDPPRRPAWDRPGNGIPAPGVLPDTTNEAGSGNPTRSPTRTARPDSVASGCPAFRQCRTVQAARLPVRSRSSADARRWQNEASPPGRQTARVRSRACGADAEPAERRSGPHGPSSADTLPIRYARNERGRRCRRRRLSAFLHSFGLGSRCSFCGLMTHARLHSGKHALL